MQENVRINRLNHTDLNMYQCGMEDCKSGHFFGPAVRDHYLIHYIHKGKGFFQANGMTYHLGNGQGFLICPDIVTYYEADREDPWTYSWVGFHGLKAELYLKHANLTAENPVFHYERDEFMNECFRDMIAAGKLKKSREIRLLGILYMFLSQLIETADGGEFMDKDANRKELYVSKAIQYVEMNYSRKISIAEMSNQIGLDRSYLYSIFKECLNTSPQEFLIQFRLNKACELMKNRILSIGDIARSVGYDDPLLFSKVFKKAKGTSPRAFRRDIPG